MVCMIFIKIGPSSFKEFASAIDTNLEVDTSNSSIMSTCEIIAGYLRAHKMMDIKVSEVPTQYCINCIIRLCKIVPQEVIKILFCSH